MGTRPDFLIQSLTSIRLAGDASIHVIAPKNACLETQIPWNLFDLLIDDPGIGLSSAIDFGLRSFPPNVEYMNWLGDDDLLSEGSLDHTLALLTDDPGVVLVYGGCEYIDESGKSLWLNRSGNYAKYVMHCGPQLIPQPGSLFRRDAYKQIGGLDFRYQWAFDLDLLIRLSRVGKLKYTPRVLAKFRWHDGSLSVGGREGSVNEASLIRIAALPGCIRPIANLWEAPIRRIILSAGNRLSVRSKSS
jgi:GT2 family glycosyltransferase